MTKTGTKVVRDLEDFAGIASDWFWETDSEHRFTYFSARMEDVTKMRTEDLIGRRRDQQTAIQNERSNFLDHLDDLANRRPFRNFEYKIKRQMSDGFLWLRVSGDPVFDADGTFTGYRGVGHDITDEVETIERLAAANEVLAARNKELDQLRRELELAAFEDPLTGLRNRRAFDAEIAKALSPPEPTVALLLIDLDRFKWVNDTHGHPAGDMVLMTAAARISALSAYETEVFRLGGDEFALIAPWSDTSATLAHGKRIINTIAAPITFKDQTFTVGASVGVALSAGLPTSPHRLIARADAALYDAKRQGRNCVRKSVA